MQGPEVVPKPLLAVYILVIFSKHTRTTSINFYVSMDHRITYSNLDLTSHLIFSHGPLQAALQRYSIGIWTDVVPSS